MAIGRITGSVLKSNLTRNGVDLAFETNLLYLDVTNSRVGIGTSEPSTELHVNGTVTASAITGLTSATISNTSTSDSILVTTTESSSTAGPVITLKRNSASPDDADYIGQIKFKGENDADQEINYAKVTGKILDASDGTEDGILEFSHVKAGSQTITGRWRSDSLQLLNSTNLSVAGDTTITGSLSFSGITLPSADGSNGQVLQTDGSGTLSFAESGGGGGGNNTAVKQFNYYKLDTTSAVIDSFDIGEYRGAVYDVEINDTVNSLIGHLRVSVIHDDTTPYVSTYDINEDSTRICDFSVTISGNTLQLSANTESSSHVNLRCYRVALGDHHETVANTNSKIISTTTNIGSTATTLDQFTKTDIQGAKYIILIKDSTASDYQISEMSLVHDGTDVFFNDYGKVSSRTGFTHTFSASISGATVTLSSLSSGNTTGTAILYRQDLGSKTKLGEVDNVLYGKIADVDSAVTTVDSFDVFKYRSARYFVNISNSDNTEYQNSEITLTVNSAGTTATISESIVSTEVGGNDLATFSADISGGKARLRVAGSPANNVVYFARLAIEDNLIYKASSDTTNNLYITHNNIKLTDTALDLSGATGSLKLPSGTTGQRSTGAVGMIRYNSSTGSYERYDTSGWVNIAKQAEASESSETTTGEKTSISTTAVNLDTFETSAFDSAFYLALTNDEINGEIATAQISLVHNNTTAFLSSAGVIQSGSNSHLQFSTDISGSTVILKGTGVSDVNSIKFFRIGLGDSTSASSSGNTATIINTDVDSAVEDLDTFAKGSYRGAKYYISANNTDSTELQNIECLVVHNGTDAFITTYNDIYTGNNALLSLTADISGSDVRLRATSGNPNTAVKMYRVLLGDSESDATSDNTKTVGQVTVSSSSTAIDTFSTDSFNGAHYVVVGNSSSESAASISEVFVVTDGSDAYVGNSQISTKDTDQLSFSAALSGTTVTLSAGSTSGASTTVNAYRVQLLRSEAGAATSLAVLTSNNQTITGTKTFTSAIQADTIRTPGSNANLNLDPQGTGKVQINGAYTLPIADGSSNQVLQTDGSGALSFGTVTAGAGGSNTQVQFNNSGSMAGSTNLIFDGTTLTASALRVTGDLTVDGTNTIMNTTTLSVEDNIIELNRNVSSNAGMPTVSGIKVNRGETSSATENDIFWAWDNSFEDDGTTLHGNAGGAWTAFRSQNEEVDALVDIRANVIHATATSANYADLAEKYENDKEYPVGTLMMVGGEKETTEWTDGNVCIGVISDKPAYLMNKSANGQAHAIRGKVPVRCLGVVLKGSKIYGYSNGTAGIQGKEFIGIALQTNNDPKEKLVECILKI